MRSSFFTHSDPRNVSPRPNSDLFSCSQRRTISSAQSTLVKVKRKKEVKEAKQDIRKEKKGKENEKMKEGSVLGVKRKDISPTTRRDTIG